MKPGYAAVLLSAALPGSAVSQAGVMVKVVAEDTRAPLHGAVVSALRNGHTELTDRVGHARFVVLVQPETLVVAAIGFRVDTIIALGAPVLIEVRLRRQAVTLAEVTVTGETRPGLTPTLAGEWVVPGELLRSAPAAIENDVFRALAMVPSVSFSTPLSARPIIRGYDAPESVVRIDGFEILNPYHIGKIFSSFPMDATESVTVAPQPNPGDGGALAGVVDVRGRRSGDADGPVGGVDVTLASAAGWLGTQRPLQGFVSGRAGFLEAVTNLLTHEGFQYNFQDLYGHAAVGVGQRGSWETTIYASRDDLGETEQGAGTRWSSLLFGNRIRWLDGSKGSLDAVGSLNAFKLTGLEVSARNSRIDVANRFSRLTGGVRGVITARAVKLTGEVDMSLRRMSHDLTVRSGDDFEAETLESATAEGSASVALHAFTRSLAIIAGLRLDATEAAAAWQPRARLSAVLGRRVTGAVAFSRAIRLYQVVTDPQPEPTVTAFDFWYGVGENGIPVPRVDHLSATVEADWRPWSITASAFLSSGTGLGELRPAWDQRVGVSPLRFGRSRTGGVELRLAWRGEGTRPAASVITYVLSRSERLWDPSVWTPWRLDRRHNLRLQLQLPAGRWEFFGLGEVASGQPLTVVEEVIWIEGPWPGATVPPPPRLRYRYGPEGAGRSAGTFHLDLGGRYRFEGPGGSEIRIGFSIVNVAFGPVAPEVPVDPGELINPDGSYSAGGVRYKRLFKLPPVPSISARVEF